jgi:hypothetical protein
VTLGVAGETLTDATGTTTAVTVIEAVPLLPSLVAVIVAEPAAIPDTTPVEETVAIPVLELAHVTTRLVTTLPFATRVVAVNCVVCPTLILDVDGETVTEVTGTARGVTLTVDFPLKLLLVAVMMMVPSLRALTSPVAETVATPAFSLDQSTFASETGSPLTSSTRATRVPWEPTARLSCGGTTSTDATVWTLTGSTHVTAATPINTKRRERFRSNVRKERS